MDSVSHCPRHRARVLLVDDSGDMVDMLSRLIGGQPDLEIVGALGSAEGIVDEVVRSGAEVVVLDLTMPGPPALGAIRALAELAPRCRVIAFSGYDDADTRDAANVAGAWELVSKHGDPHDILPAIRRVAGARRAEAGST